MKNKALLLVLCLSVIIVFTNVRYLQRVLIGWGDDSSNKGTDSSDTHDRQVHDEPSLGPTRNTHKVAELTHCDKFGGPSEEIASEMVYWRDIPKDAEFVSPFAKYGPNLKYLTFEPDEGGWNNIRMSMETATALAHAMGRILVLPPTRPIYLLWDDEKKTNNRFTFKDFYHFDSIAREHTSVNVISMEDFLLREAATGHLRDKMTGSPSFPPGNRTDWNFGGGDAWKWMDEKEKKLWHWLRTATAAPIWDFEKCIAVIPKEPGPEGAGEMKAYMSQLSKNQWNARTYDRRPTPVNATTIERMKEMLERRKKLCVYDEPLQNAPVIHFMGDNDSGARLLTHFYSFLFFEDWRQDLWTKRFVRDHLRYVDEIQCAAARIVHALREKVREHGQADGSFDSMHIRRGDFQYKETRIEAKEIYENIRDVMPDNSTLFIATDEKDFAFFEPLRQRYHLYFLRDFQDLIPDLNKNYYGMLDQRIASRGRTFAGAQYSTFTGYINRMRGYHSVAEKLPGYDRGDLKSYFYVPRGNKMDMRHYKGIQGPYWAREFPIGWRDIDHDIERKIHF